MMNKLIDKFTFYIEQKRYFEAHEVFESFWFPRRFEDNDEIKLIKGFINAAVSFELFKRGRKEQSKKVWKTYLKYKQLIDTLDSPHKSRYYELSKFIEEKYQTLQYKS